MRFFAIFCPPLAVLMARKPIQAIIAFFLWLLFWIPGSIYAWGIVTDYKNDQRMKTQVKYQRELERKDYERQQKEQEREAERWMKEDEKEYRQG